MTNGRGARPGHLNIDAFWIMHNCVRHGWPVKFQLQTLIKTGENSVVCLLVCVVDENDGVIVVYASFFSIFCNPIFVHISDNNWMKTQQMVGAIVFSLPFIYSIYSHICLFI